MVRIVFYGRLSDLMGREREASFDAETATVGALMDWLAANEVEFAAALAGMRVQYALNDRIASADAKLKSGDEIAVLPPFSGG